MLPIHEIFSGLLIFVITWITKKIPPVFVKYLNKKVFSFLRLYWASSLLMSWVFLWVIMQCYTDKNLSRNTSISYCLTWTIMGCLLIPYWDVFQVFVSFFVFQYKWCGIGQKPIRLKSKPFIVVLCDGPIRQNTENFYLSHYLFCLITIVPSRLQRLCLPGETT